MAHGVDKGIRVHQALHGYADGHRLIACSTQLKPRDQKTMLFMSDVSGGGAELDSSGYLTGYPLADSGLYAIGRTWAATEMVRPGCVWTHTLLLEFADLANLPEMRFLDNEFERPSSLEARDYTSPLTIGRLPADQTFRKTNHQTLKNILAALYEFPRDKIVSAADEDSTRIAFLVWAQQWPRLRRTFRFCTLAFADRSLEGAPFDLQFTPTRDRSIRSRFSEAVDSDRKDVPPSSWLEDALEDISWGQEGKLRQFLKEVGGDVAGGREMFVPLCLLHRMIPRFGTDSALIENAISLIDSTFDSTSASSLRSLLVTAVARHPESINARSADFLIANFEMLNEASLTDPSHELGRALWSYQPDKVLQMAQIPGSQSSFATATIETLPKGRLIDSVMKKPGLLTEVIHHRPDLLSEPQLWTVKGDWPQKVLSSGSFDSADIVKAILRAQRYDLLPEAIRAFGTLAMLKGASQITTELGQEHVDYSFWLDAAINDPSCIADFFDLESNIPISILLAIAKGTHPDALPNDVGSDPWATALSKISGRLDEKNQQFLAGYLLARAFGYRSHSQVDLIAYSFDEVYFGALNERLGEEAWGFLERALPRSWFSDWDHCQKLRDGVTDLFVNRDLPSDGFPRITRDDALFNQLVQLTSHNSRGRKYLKKVRRSLEESGGLSARIGIIKDVL
jgi:hypothetical protein